MLLRNQIESVAGKHNVVHFSLSTFSCGYHLIDVNKMIQYILSYIGTCFFCLLAAMCHESCFLAVMRCKPSFTAKWAFRVVKFLKMPMSALFV